MSKMLDGIRHGVFLSMSQCVDFAMRPIHRQMLIEEYWVEYGHVLHAH